LPSAIAAVTFPCARETDAQRTPPTSKWAASVFALPIASKLVVRAENFNGPTLAEFNDEMTTNEVKAKFAELPKLTAAG
jgi:hypothetical protein